MKSILSILLLALMFQSHVCAQRYFLEFDNEKSADILEKAERAYANNKFPRSVKLYDQLMSLEGESHQIIYNQLTSLIHLDDSLRLEIAFRKLDSLGFLDCNYLASTEDFKSIKHRKRFIIWQKAVKSCSNSEVKYIKDQNIQNPSLRKQLLWMKMNDVISDIKVIHKIRYDSYPELDYNRLKVERTRIYVNNFAQLRTFVKEHGWPGKNLVGEDGAEAAWIIAQHANHFPAGQKEVLSLLKMAVEAGEAKMEHYAHLYDRVQANFNLPQKYGTLRWKNPETNAWGVYTLQDSTRVNQFRAKAGLPPIDIQK